MTDETNPWAETTPNQPEKIVPRTTAAAPKKTLQKPEPVQQLASSNAEFDTEGLMTDFPTATDLERFVFDQTGVVLNLKGRAPCHSHSTKENTSKARTSSSTCVKQCGV